MKSLKYTLPILLLTSVFLWTQLINAKVSAYVSIDKITPGYAEAGIDNISEISHTSDELESTTSNSDYLTAQTIIKNDPYLNRQWPLSTIDMPDSIHFEEKDPVIIAVLDTGIDKNHEDLQGKVIAEVNFTDSPTSDDINGHGTFVAGIISAASNNGIGIAGMVPNSHLLNVKVANDNGNCKGINVARGIKWATDHGANVINLSIDLRMGFSDLENAIDYAWKNGVVIVAAASNQTIKPVYPARYKNCISTVAIDKYYQEGPLSGYGDWVNVAAPGITVYSTLPLDKYGFKSGTSFAVAHVTGLAALLFEIAQDQNHDGKTNDEIRAAIENGATLTVSNNFKCIDVVNSIQLIR